MAYDTTIDMIAEYHCATCNEKSIICVKEIKNLSCYMRCRNCKQIFHIFGRYGSPTLAIKTLSLDECIAALKLDEKFLSQNLQYILTTK